MRNLLLLTVLLLAPFAASMSASADTSWRDSQLVQELQRDFEEALVFQQRILAGELSGAGLSNDTLAWIIDFGTAYMRAHPEADMNGFERRWVEPMLVGSPSILRGKAYRFLAERAVLTRQWDPRIGSLFESPSASGTPLDTQSALLMLLMPTFASSPEWQRAARLFMSQVAPGGRAIVAVHSLAAAANVYFGLKVFNSALSDEVFGHVKFPTGATNLPSRLREILKRIALAGLAADGWKLAPGGFAEVDPYEKRTIVSEAMQDAMRMAFGSAQPW